MTEIKSCNCNSAYQDKTCGAGQRVHNWCAKHPNKDGGWRCTVCGNVRGK